MKCEICGTELRAEPAITEQGWIIFHECIIRGKTEQETIDNYEKNRASAHNSDYARCEHKNVSAFSNGLQLGESSGFCHDCNKPVITKAHFA